MNGIAPSQICYLNHVVFRTARGPPYGYCRCCACAAISLYCAWIYTAHEMHRTQGSGSHGWGHKYVHILGLGLFGLPMCLQNRLRIQWSWGAKHHCAPPLCSYVCKIDYCAYSFTLAFPPHWSGCAYYGLGVK